GFAGRHGRGAGRLIAAHAAARLRLPLAPLQVLTELCGQSLLAQLGLVRLRHCPVPPNPVFLPGQDKHFLALRRTGPYGTNRPVPPAPQGPIGAGPCCRSSVVEHSLGKGEAVSSILTGSTIKTPANPALSRFSRFVLFGNAQQNVAR